ncbi:hypothetical protein AB833_05620 [Chromatiales bacterium (ex Bugula neritina AB1)]|nr:hypothetical protein AB833_05620 [Chromatiales bacterium (ex Bugula neritina AB1)]
MTATARPAHSFGQRVRRFFLRLILLVLFPLIALLVASHFYMKGGRYVSTENAYVKSHIIAISSDVDGRVVEVNVRDNQHVEANALLFRIDPEPYALRVAEAQAEIELARSEIESMRADYRESQDAIAVEAENVRFMTTQLKRQQALQNTGVTSVETLDEAQHKQRIAEQRVAVLQQRAKQVLANLGGNSSSAVTSHASYVRAKSRLDQAAIDLANTSVYAPSGGIISNMHLQAGEYVKAGTPVFSLLENNRIWVQANLKETQLTNLRAGQSAILQVDAYPEMEWRARVASIAPATGAEFALLPPQNATGNWVKVVQRISVELQVEHQSEAPTLRAGMTVTAKIDTNRRRQPPAILRKLVERDDIPRPLEKMLRLTLAMDNAQREVSSTGIQTDLSAGLPARTASRPLAIEVAAILPLNANIPPSDNVQPGAKPSDKANRPERSRPQKTPDDDTSVEIDSTIKREEWLSQQAETKFTIQVGSSTDLAFLQRFAEQLPADFPNVIYHYKYSENQQPEYGLASGLFDSRKRANEAIGTLPEKHRRYDPWVRRIGEIQRTIVAN